MDTVHQKIIDAIIRKAELVCPGALDLIGIYGSVATGDTHARSDLDLLVLINDDDAYQLAEAFILDDSDIGYDIYCTTWRSLERDALCPHARLSKLLDAQIVYATNASATPLFAALQEKTHVLLASPGIRINAGKVLENAKTIYADCFLCDSLPQLRTSAGGVIHHVCDALMLFHGRYFKLGVKRTFEELADLALPFDVQGLVMQVIRAETVDTLRAALTELLRTVQAYMTIPPRQAAPSEDNLIGTYEEMYSNWRSKMIEAAENNDLFSSYMSMVSLQRMFCDIARDAAIAVPDVMDAFNPHDPAANAAAFDHILEAYLDEYKKAGMQPARYTDVDAFVAAYLA